VPEQSLYGDEVLAGIMPLYTPIAGSCLNMTKPAQRILVQRAVSRQHPERPMNWLAVMVRGWNAAPTPFVWGGKRAARRARRRTRQHALGGSGACTYRPIQRSRPTIWAANNG